MAFFGAFLGGAIPGSFTASLSIAPMYAGMISSFTLIAGAFGNILAPALVGFIVEKVKVLNELALKNKNFQGTQFEWGMVFAVCVLVNFIGGVVFLIFGTGETRPALIV